MNMSVKINMLYGGENIKGQGVLSATLEQNKLCLQGLSSKFSISINDPKYNHDIFHVHTINPRFYFRFNKYKKHGVLVGHCHCIPETIDTSINLPKPFKKVFYKYLINFYKQMDYLITVNPEFIDKLAKYGIDKEKITYIPNYVDKDLFHKTGKPKDKYRIQYGLDKDKFTVLAVGQTQTRKGIFDFIEVAKMMPDVQFVWAGGFSFKKLTDGYKKIKQIMNNPPENVKFLGIVDREYMIQVYNMCDVLFVPSYEELFPMTILEAFCVNLPVLTRDLEYFPQILFDYYIHGHNNEDFVTLIRRLKDDPQFYELCVKKSYDGHGFYSKKSITQMWENFYTKVALDHNLFDREKE